MADRAIENLSYLQNVRVICASAAEGVLPEANVIYVNAGATHPPASWLDALKVDGRLIFPLTTDDGVGCMLLVTRRGEAKYEASTVARVSFIPCVGARDAATSIALARALETQSLKMVKSLRRGTQPDATAWCVGNDWWLSTAPA